MSHEAVVASKLGLRGIPGEAESIMAQRDIALAELTGGRIHIAHMSARQTPDAVRCRQVARCERDPRGGAASLSRTDEMLAALVALRHQHTKIIPPLARNRGSRRHVSGHRRR